MCVVFVKAELLRPCMRGLYQTSNCTYFCEVKGKKTKQNSFHTVFLDWFKGPFDKANRLSPPQCDSEPRTLLLPFINKLLFFPSVGFLLFLACKQVVEVLCSPVQLTCSSIDPFVNKQQRKSGG